MSFLMRFVLRIQGHLDKTGAERLPVRPISSDGAGREVIRLRNQARLRLRSRALRLYFATIFSAPTSDILVQLFEFPVYVNDELNKLRIFCRSSIILKSKGGSAR